MKSRNAIRIGSFKGTMRRSGEPGFASASDPLPDETLDALFAGELKLYQARNGYRFSLDSVLLANFVTLRGRERVADLGTGNGIIPLILAHLYPSASFVGVEIQASMAERAARNIRLNHLQDRIAVLSMPVCAVVECCTAGSFEAVVCNPPYRRAGSGRRSHSAEKQIARHEIEGTLDDFVRAGAFMLPAKGRLSCIHLAERAADLLTGMRSAGLEPKRIRAVHPFVNAGASTVLVEGVKGARTGLKVLPPLVIYDQAVAYTAEVVAMLAGPLRRR